MAKLSVGANVQIDMNDFSSSLDDTGYADVTSFSSRQIEGYVDGYRIVIKGSGFKVDSDGYLAATGTINSIQQTYAGQNHISLSGISLSVSTMVDAFSSPYSYDDIALEKAMFAGSDIMSGGNYADVLNGYAGNDQLVGGRGSDGLYGGTGNDRLYGGLGADSLFGQGGADTFVYKSLSDSKAPYGRDTIFDFSGAGGDKIDLSAIDANTKASGNQAFAFIGTKAFSGKAGELRYEKLASDSYVYADVNGDKKADFAINLDDAITFAKGYFVL